ncbi:uncharacterized protein LOC110990078 isoform X2 [Acanthaster planci]|uniref:Uncharacterized protein LOC110990078 isoform X2 n=1 Tax=Acanthaster planci TaxID=133434 RepID=A0A8B7ZYG2_ACAPL|nr:uncharacterized protein LOC110990078 isoform X2 [Acanthaster planci]
MYRAQSSKAVYIMAMQDALVTKLYEYLQRKTCLCHMAGTSKLRDLSSFKSWLRGEDGTENARALRGVEDQRGLDDVSIQKSTARTQDDTGYLEHHGTDRVSLQPLETCTSSPGDPLNVGFADQSCEEICESDQTRHKLAETTNAVLDDSLQRDVDDSDSCFRPGDKSCPHQRRLPADSGKLLRADDTAQVQVGTLQRMEHGQLERSSVPDQGFCWKIRTCPFTLRQVQEESSVTSTNRSFVAKSRDRKLLCLTVGKELFEAVHCLQLLSLQLEMVNRGSLLEELGVLMSSEDRLSAFMACKMAKAVLASSAVDKETAVSFLRHHLLCSLSAIRTVLQPTRHFDQNRRPLSPSGQLSQTERQRGQVHRGHTSPMEVVRGKIDLGQTDMHKVSQNDSGQICVGQVGSDQTTSGQACMVQRCTGLVNSGLTNSGQDIGGQVDKGENHTQMIHSLGNPNRSKHHPDLSEVNSGQVNHAIFTFDLCRLLLTKICYDENKEPNTQHPGPERNHTSCKGVFQKLADQAVRLQDFQTAVERTLRGDLPAIFQEVASLPPAGEDKTARVNWDGKDVSLVLVSLLDLTRALVRHRGGAAEQHCAREFAAKLASPLTHLLEGYCEDLVVLKRILDIFSWLMDHSATSALHSGQSHSSGHLPATVDYDLVTAATAFLKTIEKGNFLERFPYRSGPVGFGGRDFHPGGCDEDDSSGDHALLRKLCRAILCAVKTLVTSENSGKNSNKTDVGRCLQVVSDFVCRQLNLAASADVPMWLFELFADQDDGLVWAMQCCLDLYKAFKSVQPPGCPWTNQLNPHRIFGRFLDTVAYDPSVLLDLLISSETQFLKYLVSYLHTILGDWNLFRLSHQEASSKDSNSHLKRTSDMTSKTFSDDEEPHLACDVQCQEEAAVPEFCQRNKRRKTDTRGGADQRIASPTDALNRSPSIQTSTPACTSPKDTKKSSPTPSDMPGISSVSPAVQTPQTLSRQTDAVSQSLDDVMTTLIRLRFSIERISGSNLFPYPVAPLLRLLERVEDMYEGEE